METHNIHHDDLVPGTVLLVQEGRHGASTKHDIVLLPPPSTDPTDPLRWSRLRKSYHLFLLFAYSAIMGAVTNWESPIYLQLLSVYATTIDNLNIGAALMLLLLGVGNIFTNPLSNKLGRRFIYNVSLITVFTSQIWMGFSKNVGDFYGAHILLGLGAAPFEALVAVSISDVWFVHERGSKLGTYVFGLAFGSFIGPLCSGYMAVNQGWRWIYWWGAILSGALLVLFFFTFEESRFIRSREDTEGQNNEVEVERPESDTREAAIDTKDAGKYATSEDPDLHRQISLGPKVGDVFDAVGFTIQLGIFKHYPEAWTEILSQMWRPLKVSTLPAVVWCGLNYGTCVSWLSVLATTTASIFSAPPYLFTWDKLGLIWISPMIGSLVGAYFSGPLNDRFVLFLSRRNRGFREPEYRLWAFIPSAVILPAGLMIYGVTSAHGLHWIVPIVGTGLVGFGLSVAGAVTMSYILDCYPLLDTQVITTIILIRNIVGFGITWGIQPWITNMGQQNTFICVGALSFAITSLALFFIAFGKTLRRWTALRYMRLARIP